MNQEIRKRRIDDQIRLVQEWMLSGMTQVEFAASKGIGLRALEYRIRKIRELSPESLTEECLASIEFIQVPDEYMQELPAEEEMQPPNQAVLTVQSSGVCLQVTDNVNPNLLKTAMEVMLGC